MITYEVIIPTLADNVSLIEMSVRSLQIHLPPNYKKITLIGPNNVADISSNLNVSFMPEDDVIEGLTCSDIKLYLEQRGANPQRAGWYYQQFIKLGYALCDTTCNLYLVWDSDTVALKDICLERDEKLLFAESDEYHQPYFNTLQKLTGLHRQVNYSFISEFMLFDKDITKELLGYICDRNHVSVNNVFRAILDTIDTNDLNSSGFSEFETYGNYSVAMHPNKYTHYAHKKLRNAYVFFPSPPE